MNIYLHSTLIFITLFEFCCFFCTRMRLCRTFWSVAFVKATAMRAVDEIILLRADRWPVLLLNVVVLYHWCSKWLTTAALFLMVLSTASDLSYINICIWKGSYGFPLHVLNESDLMRFIMITGNWKEILNELNIVQNKLCQRDVINVSLHVMKWPYVKIK